MVRAPLLLFAIACAACTPPEEPIGGNGCGFTLDVNFASSDDMVQGYPAVNDATRLRCDQLAAASMRCTLPFTSVPSDCFEARDAALAALADADIGGATATCMDPCTGAPVPE